MNKRIKKKNDDARINIMLIKGMDLVDEYMLVYARLAGRKNHHINFYTDWERYNKWNKSIPAHRTWKYILKTNNLPKYIGYKNKIIRT